MSTSAVERRRLNRRNAAIAAYLEALPVGEHLIIVTMPALVELKMEGSFVFWSDEHIITLQRKA